MDEQDIFEGAGSHDGQGDSGSKEREPLAERLRPRTLDEVVGQHDALAADGFLRSAIEQDDIPSLILWGPPGSGKTSLAKVVTHSTKARFIPFSAVLSGVKDVRQVVKDAGVVWRAEKRGTILFVDEIHRFNKAQQDAFLPHVESGAITLIGATTENPFFEVTPPLLSRCRVVRLSSLTEDDLLTLGRRALDDAERGLKAAGVTVHREVLSAMTRGADGDGRRMLNLLEAAVGLARRKGLDEVDEATLDAVRAGPVLRYDRAYEEHYNVISAFIKSLRGSDPDAAIYYMARMLEGGEDSSFICRRMIIFAAEDVGNADPRALRTALAAKDAWEYLGMPEAAIPMAQAATYLATAPKSNASYLALRAAQQAVRETGSLDVPMHIRNAPVKGMAKMGYGQGYSYPHDYEGHWVCDEYLPVELCDMRFYDPSGAGYEQDIRKRLDKWRDMRTRHNEE